MRSRTAAALTLACTLLTSARARADAPTIETIEYGSWSASIATMQTDPRSEGTTLHVVVRDDAGRLLVCGTYALTLDEAGQRAFAVLGCDPTSRATPLTLLHRSALFDHDARDSVSRPRAIHVVATRVESAQAGGGARVEAASTVSCSAEVRPYIPDLERGQRVALRPDRYALRVPEGGARVTSDETHWTITRDGAAPAAIDYELADSSSGEIVLRDRVALACGSTSTPTAIVPALRAQSAAMPDADRPSEPAPKSHEPETGWSLGARAGLAVLRAGSAMFENRTGMTDAASLGVRDVAGVGAGLAFSFERDWLFTSVTLDFGCSSVAERTLCAISGSSAIAPSLRFGDARFYAGPGVTLGAYELTGVRTSTFEWSTKPDLGLGAAAGARLDLRGRGDGPSTITLGFDVIAPIAGRQPFFAVASLGWGALH